MKITVQVQVSPKYMVPGELRAPEIQQGLYQISKIGSKGLQQMKNLPPKMDSPNLFGALKNLPVEGPVPRQKMFTERLDVLDHNLVISVPADIAALNGEKPSAGTALITIDQSHRCGRR